jgi:hypothetical protein
VRLSAALSAGWRVRLTYRALDATPLPFDQEGRNALVEVRSRVSGELRRGAERIHVRDAPGFYEYQSTPLARARDGAPAGREELVARLGALLVSVRP